MKLSITPFSNIVFWLKALVCSSFYILGFSAFAAPAGFGVAILILLLAFGITILLIRDRVFVFEKETLRISSAINFFPFNRIFRTFTYSLNEIDYIKLSFDDGIRYWGIVFNLELKKNMLTAADIEKNLDQTLKDLGQKSKVFFIAFVNKSNIDKWADKIEALGIKVVRKE